ncbi:DUF6597 domain-containing transcriptional factor [Arthrobacter sp. MDT3-24]
MVGSFKGILYPARLPTFHRVPAPESVTNLVQWFWIPEWDIEPGHTSRQHVIAFPTSNLVVQEDLVEFAGPTTRRSHRDLTGRGWAVGALLRPALVPRFTDDPGSLRDSQLPLPLADLHASVSEAMRGTDPGERRQRAVEAFTGWLVTQSPEVSEEGFLANAMMDIIGTSADVTSIEDVAARLFVSPRTLQRAARKYIGLSPSALIRRRRWASVGWVAPVPAPFAACCSFVALTQATQMTPARSLREKAHQRTRRRASDICVGAVRARYEQAPANA